MNKRLFTLLACALIGGLQAFSCAKSVEEEAPEEQRPQPSGNFASVEAYIVQPAKAGETKTNYTLEGNQAIFHWVDNLDHIDVTVTKGTTLSSVAFTKMPDEGDNINFFCDGQISGQATMNDMDGYVLSDWAFYPSRVSPEAQDGDFKADWSYEGGDFKLDLPVSMRFPTQKPLAVVPMLGKRDADGKYAFDQMTGVLAVPVNNLPDDADFISITSEGMALAGCFTLMEAGGVKYIAARAPQSDAEKTLTLRFSGLSGNQVFYFPVAVGEIPAGMVLTVGNSAKPEEWMIKANKKATTITRGNIVKTPALEFEPMDLQWEDFGTVEYLDNFLWGKDGFTSGEYVTVAIQRSALFPNNYRIANPYLAAAEHFNHTIPSGIAPGKEYLSFKVKDDGKVTFPSFDTGIDFDTSHSLTITHPTEWQSYGGNNTAGNASNNLVTETHTDGTLGVIQLMPIFHQTGNYKQATTAEGGYYYPPNNSRKVFIRFPAEPDPVWTKVADGTFIDEKIWSLHEWGDTRVPIELYQDELNENHFRVPNPYQVAKTQFSYSTYTQGIEADDDLIFFVKEGDAVKFTTFLAGIEDINSGGKAMKVWYPSDYGSGYTTALAANLVRSYMSSGLPEEVELYPIYSDAGGSDYKYTNHGDYRCRLSFPDPNPVEVWTDVATLRYMDDFYVHRIAGKAEGVSVPITLQQSNLDINRYRIANPYPALIEAAGVGDSYQYPGDDVDDYLVMTVDSENKITFGEFRPGIGRSDWEFSFCDPDLWNTLSSKTMKTGYNRVVSYSLDGVPQVIYLYGVYHKIGEYDTGNRYSRDDDSYSDRPFIAAAFPLDSWTSIGTGRFKDKLVWECAGLTGYAEAEFQQNVNYPNKFRIAKPYPGDNSDAWFVFDVSDPNQVVSTKYYLDYEVTASGKASYKPYIWTSYYTNNYCKVLSTQANGMPAVVELGVCYRYEPWISYDYEIGRDHEELAIEIVFPGCAAYYNAVVNHYAYSLEKNYNSGNNPLASLVLPNGTLTKMVIKLSGVDMSAVAGLRLYQNGWMDSDYVAPDSDGVVTMTSFTKPTVSGGIDLNIKLNSNPVGQVIRFEILEIEMTIGESNKSIDIVQDKTVGHYPGVVVNNGGNKLSVRGFGGIAEETVASFRIPALVTSNDGTLIAAYDVRYEDSSDLCADIDVGVKRSTDGGKTWSNLVLAMDMDTYGYDVTSADSWKVAQRQNGIGDPCLLVDENTGRIFCFATWAHGHYYDGDKRSLAYAGKGYAIEDTPQFMMVYSDDDGVTWSDPINLTRQVKQYDWRMTFQGPGRGITMKNGTLVIPFQHQEEPLKLPNGLVALHSGVAYSTDHGETWRTHNLAHTITSEACVAEVEPGVLLLSMRDETNSHGRRAYTTEDLGRTWTAHASNGLIYGDTCEASMIHVDAGDNVLNKDLTIISNPVGIGRYNLTIHISIDKGKTYPYELVVDQGGSAYSCLTMIDNATVGILYEGSRGNIYFQAIPLTDIVK